MMNIKELYLRISSAHHELALLYHEGGMVKQAEEQHAISRLWKLEAELAGEKGEIIEFANRRSITE